MSRNKVAWNETAGQLMRDGRMRLETQGALQDYIATHVGVSQGHLSQMEKGKRSPRLRTFANWYSVVEPGLYPEEERFLWQCVIGGTETVDFASKLGLRTYDQARARARSEMDSGYSRDAYYTLRALKQLASTDEEKARASLLMGNRAKDLGIFEVGTRFSSPAEDHYNCALSLLSDCNSAEARDMRDLVLVNLAELHFDLRRPVLAEPIIDSLLQRRKGLRASVRSHAYFVRGRIQAARGDATAAVRNFRTGRAGYSALGNEHLADWITMHIARVRGDKEVLEDLVRKAGPGHDPARPNELRDPETFAWSKYHLAELTGRAELAEETRMVGERFGFRHLVVRAMAFVAEHQAARMILIGIAAATAMTLIDGSFAEVFAKSCNDVNTLW